jgi:hypothetical protein
VKAAVGTITNRVIDALICQKADHCDGVQPDIAHEIVEIGRVEEAGRGLGDDHLVPDRRDHIEDLRIPGALQDKEVRQLVVEAAVAPIRGEIFHHGINDFNAPRASALHQTLDVYKNMAPRHLIELGAQMPDRFVHDPVLDINDKHARPLPPERQGSGREDVALARSSHVASLPSNRRINKGSPPPNRPAGRKYSTRIRPRATTTWLKP